MSHSLRLADLRCENLDNPLGIACSPPHLSWKIFGPGRAVRQTAYEIEVSNNPDFTGNDLLLRQTEHSDACYAVRLGLKHVCAKSLYYWRVRVSVEVEGTDNQWLPWSETAHFETGLSSGESFRGQWIEADDAFYQEADLECRKYWKTDGFGKPGDAEDQGLRRVPYLAKDFELKPGFSKARVYITARGLYELSINGAKVGPCSLAPDFTAYDKCIYYQTFDIGDLLQPGANRFDILLGDGWYVGHAQGIPGLNHLYGERPSLLMQAEIEYAGEETVTLVSDSSFTASVGPLQYADLFMGEFYDLQCDAASQFGTVARDYPKSVLIPQQGEMIVATEVIPAKKVFRDAEGSLIVDFGQVIAGRERLTLKGEAGSVVTIEHSEEIDSNGIFFDGLQKISFHEQKNTIRFRDHCRRIYEPQFSFQGFRYLRISGLDYDITPEACEAVVIGTGMAVVGTFQCSNQDLNQLMKNVLWSQRGNMLSIPTDCPQRERGGFTGDAQVFAKASAFNMDVASFFARWLEQCRHEQLERGQIPIVVPYTRSYRKYEPNPGWTSTGWGDAIIFLPWEMYQAYGDIRFLRDNYQAMLKWMSYAEICAKETMPERNYNDFVNHGHRPYLWNAGFHWGDWLLPGYDAFEGMRLTKEITASLCYYREVKTMLRIASELEDTEKSDYFETLGANIHSAFHQEYITPEGRMTVEWQGAYVMAIAFGIVDGELKEAFAQRLNERVIEKDYHLETGFLSTPFLLETLWSCGYRDTAHRILYQDTPPSWLYQVKNGATTIWEEWTGKDPAGVVKGTSFNHYAFGSVCDFIYERVAGVQKLENAFKRVRIAPQATDGLEYAEASIETIFGKLFVKWAREQDGFRYWIELPHNTTAIVFDGPTRLELGSGRHEMHLRAPLIDQ